MSKQGVAQDQTAARCKAALQVYADASDARFLQRFFKTGQGQYGEGDVFIGIRVPQTRQVCKQFRLMPPVEVQKLLNSPVHEHRLAAVIILVAQFERADADTQQVLYQLYLKNVYDGRINNWDIVDISAPRIVGSWLLDKPHDVLFSLAAHESVWPRRVAVLSTFMFIANGRTDTFFALAEKLLHDSHDLMHKAIGWGIREVGKRCSREQQLQFLDLHAHEMPRTMLRYAIEHLSPEQRAYYLAQKQRAGK